MNFIKHKIKASSLFYTIVISLVIAIVSSSLILFAYLGRIEFENTIIQQRLHLNVNSGLNLLMSRQSTVTLNSRKTIDLYGTGRDSVALSRLSWGAYEVITAEASFKNFKVSTYAQVGYCPDSTTSYCLYLADHDKPLSLCGASKIKGTAYLPKAGVERAYIEGQNFTGHELIDGQIKLSKEILPGFNKELIKNIQSILSKKTISENDSLIAIEKDLSNDSLKNSFKNKPIVITRNTAIKISGGSYTGNIAIISDKQITVLSDAIIKDIIIAAPKIIIEKGFKGNLQAFASDSIIVNKEVSLYYPSVLGIVKGKDSIAVSAVVLNENDSLSGNIFSYTEKPGDLTNQVGIILEEKTFVAGQVYSNGYADAKGTINGSLMCDKILLIISPVKTHSNHLLNAVIDQPALSRYYAGINLLEESTFKKVVKWLN